VKILRYVDVVVVVVVVAAAAVAVVAVETVLHFLFHD